MYKGLQKLDKGELFVKDLNDKDTRGDSVKLERFGCVRDRRKYFFSECYMVLECSGPTQWWMHINAFKRRLYKQRHGLIR